MNWQDGRTAGAFTGFEDQKLPVTPALPTMRHFARYRSASLDYYDGQFGEEIRCDKGHWQDGARLIYYNEEPTMQAAKQEALNTINQLPENTDMDEIMYRLYVLDKIRKGQEAVEQGKTISSEELKREIDSW